MQDGEIQGRLRQLREQILDITQRELHEAVNSRLPEHRRVALGTVANWEKGADALSEKAPYAAPRSDWIAALKSAFPEVNLQWLLTGLGSPTVTESEVRSPVERGRSKVRGRIFSQNPELANLGPHAQELFLDVLAQYALTATDGTELSKREDRDGVLVELAADLLFYLRLPARLETWGFVHAGTEHEKQIETFSILVLGALKGLMADRGQGDPLDWAEKEKSLLRNLRQWDEDKRADERERSAEFLPEEGKVARREDHREVG